MISIIKKNKDFIGAICEKFAVVELYVFGSAISAKPNSTNNDIDLAVIFDSNIPVEDMADYYFGFIEELEKVFDKPIDLITLQSVKNPIFREELEKTMVPLYAA